MTAAAPGFSWRSVILPAFLPTALFALGEGALIPIIPIVADDLGATLAIAGLIAAMIMVGQLLSDIPSGWLVSRIGERNAMIWGAIFALLGVLVSVSAPSPLVLGLGILMIGIATAVFSIARHAFLTTFVPVSHRARALSTLGGVFRGGWFVGPLLASLVIGLTGSAQTVFWIAVGGFVAVILVLLLLPDPEATFGRAPVVREPSGEVVTTGEAEVEAESRGIFSTLWHHRGVLARVGTAAGLISALRASRTVVLPLWAVSIGISPADTALIIGIAGGIDFALFYVSGLVMDRFGRLWSAIPAMIGLGIGFLTLSFTHDLEGAAVWFVVIAVVLALSNGLSSGVVMTLSADLAPPDDPAPFLGGFRFITDAGAAGAPLVISAATSLASLSLGVGAMGVLGFVGAFLLWRYVPRYVPKRR
ncbi:MFS transporter [Agromyces atrinae]|uniref:MFS family permease n=1 Tax=Agromyces atrinae TaxID=592376 RepID=A0A852S195_9MICO|nr:MFS transporter [Agromyces atrinae]NYD65656.1 MFS family permease [Agromyces atrinae]